MRWILVTLCLVSLSLAQAEVAGPPAFVKGEGGLVVLVCNEDPTRAPVYLAALPWDDAVVRWAVQRAEYVRGLDYQSLLRDPGERYRRLRGLVEAKYHLERARIALMAGELEAVTRHWRASRQAAESVRWDGSGRLLGAAAEADLQRALQRYQRGNPCGLVAARERIEAAYGELSHLIEAGK